MEEALQHAHLRQVLLAGEVEHVVDRMINGQGLAQPAPSRIALHGVERNGT